MTKFGQLRHVSESNWYLDGKLDGFVVGLFFLLNRIPAFIHSEIFEERPQVRPTRLTLEQRERHGEEERPGADLALRKAGAAGVRVQVVAEA